MRDVYAGIAAGELPDGTPQLADGVRAAAVTDAVLEAAAGGGWTEIGGADHARARARHHRAAPTVNGGTPR